MPKRSKPSSPPKFAVGDAVHVKPGVTDPDFSDMPLGGWVGTIKEAEAGRPPTCFVAWNSHMLETACEEITMSTGLSISANMQEKHDASRRK